MGGHYLVERFYFKMVISPVPIDIPEQATLRHSCIIEHAATCKQVFTFLID